MLFRVSKCSLLSISCSWLAIMLAGCGRVTAPADQVSLVSVQSGSFDKADAVPGQLYAVESGRFFQAGEKVGQLDGCVMPAYRLSSFGNTRYQIVVEPYGDGPETFASSLFVQGLFSGALEPDGSYVKVLVADKNQLAYQLYLEQAGTYRFAVGHRDFASPATQGGQPPVCQVQQAFRVSVTCLENCTAGQLPLNAFLDALDSHLQAVGLNLELAMKAVMMPLASQPELLSAIQPQVEKLLQDRAQGKQVDVFPVIPIDSIGAVEGALLGSNQEPNVLPEAIQVDLEQALEPSPEQVASGSFRNQPTELSSDFPGLTRGAFVDARFNNRDAWQAEKLSEVLNALSLENGSIVSYQGQDYTDVRSMIGALIESGHRIEAQERHLIANFISLSYQGLSVAMPIWLQVAMPIGPQQAELFVPATHAHYQFLIQGPLTDTEIRYFMTPGGVRFQSGTVLEAPWSAERIVDTYVCEAGADLSANTGCGQVLKLFDIAGQLKRNWDNQAVALNLPSGGYGALGVCADSTAVLECALNLDSGQVAGYDPDADLPQSKPEHACTNLYPLMHPAVIDAPLLGGEIERILWILPSDSAQQPAERQRAQSSAFSRLVQSYNFDTCQPMNLERYPFPSFEAQLQQLRPVFCR